ncbi:hypothetical protein CHARACLAT_028216 [Characodon lateralis]|uniref:HECT domain-containing protein n=1 Tax=Characodon lateralis TaxID=208331 RepID=A0ABU7D4C0_9TELE|nr:hypothetical protein [Characodon lateralis]
MQITRRHPVHQWDLTKMFPVHCVIMNSHRSLSKYMPACLVKRKGTGADDTSKHLSSLSDILRFLQERIDNTKTFNLNVTRQDLHQRGLKQWARQKQASPKNQLRISFIGEQGTDDGALRREFLTETVGRSLPPVWFKEDQLQTSFQLGPNIFCDMDK